MSTTPKRNKDGKFVSKKSNKKPSTLLKVETLSHQELPSTLRTRLALLGEMKKYGFKNAEIQGLLRDIYTQVVSQQNTSNALAVIGNIGNVAKKDATQMVPVSNIQASSMTPNFETVRGFFLTGQQKHPDFPDWIPSSEIGEPLGMKADQVKKYSSQYAGTFNKDLPNNQAMSLVKQNGGFFKGVSTLVDVKGLPMFLDEDLGAIACWYLMEDGKLVWRNYWSPRAVNQIRKLMGKPPVNGPTVIDSKVTEKSLPPSAA
jgi:hypothetical protein